MSSAHNHDPLAPLRESNEKPETAKRAFSQLGIAAVVAAAVLGLYGWNAQRALAAKKLFAESLPLIDKGDVGSLREAQTKLEEAVSRGGSAQAQSALAETAALLWVEHGVAEAKATAQEVTRAVVSDGIESSHRFAAEGLVAIGEGRAADAEKNLGAVVARGANSERIYFALGLAEMQLGKTKLARAHLKRAHEMKNQVPHYARALGDAEEDGNNNRDGAFAWEDAVKGNPAYVAGVARDLVGKLRRGEPRQTVLDTLAMMKKLPADQNSPAGLAALAYTDAALAMVMGDSAKALSALDEAQKIEGEKARYSVWRAAATIASGKAVDGIAMLKVAHEKLPLADRYLYTYVQTLIAAGKTADAVTALTKAATGREEDPYYHSQLAIVQAYNKNFSASKASSDKALELQSDFPEALLATAISAWKQKKYDDALPQFNAAITAKPKFPELYEALGLMWVEEGALSQANPQLDMAEKMYRANDADPIEMNRFYNTVIAAYTAAKGGSTLVKEWNGRVQAYRAGTQPPLP